jgi:hypothetical protein
MQHLKPLHFLLHSFRWWLLLVPLVTCVIIFRLSTMDFQGWSNYSVFKDLMELAHPGTLLVFTFIMAVRYFISRTYLEGWLLALGVSLFCRELHFWGTGTAIYIALAILFYLGWKNKARLTALTGNRTALSLFCMVFVCYFVSQFLDRGIAKRIGWVILWDFTWEMPHQSNLEEFLEFLGGFFLMLTPLFLRMEKKAANPET